MYNKNQQNRIDKFISYGILPENLNNLNEEMEIILAELVNMKVSFDTVFNRYVNHASTYGKQCFIHRKIIHKRSMRTHVGVDPNLKPEDIIINEYCPFFKTKIDFSSATKHLLTKYAYSIDRIDNSKMYLKGNIWIISRFANAIKNDSSLAELKTFSINILRQTLGNLKTKIL